MQDLQCYPWNFKLIKNVKDIVVFLTKKVLISVNLSFLSLISKKWASHFRREPAIKNKQFEGTKTLKSNSYLISFSFKGYLCKSEIVIFAWNVIWNNANSLWVVYYYLITILYPYQSKHPRFYRWSK